MFAGELSRALTESVKPVLELYKRCYNLEGEPFRLSPDHRFSFAHHSYANAKAYLEYALSQGEGIIAVTGQAGTGKTTLINDLLEEIDHRNRLVATLTSVQLDLEHLIKQIVSSFGLQCADDSINLCLNELEEFLIQRYKSGKTAVLIVDEAQGLTPSSLEELRLLSNLQYDNRLLLQVFLIGQDRLLEMIEMPGMEHLQQRLIAASSLQPLDLDETVSYLEYRLIQVGWQGDPAIDEEAIRVIHGYSGGIPRRINLISHRLLMHGGMQQKHDLSGEDVRHVIEELRREHLLPADLATADLSEETLLAVKGENGDASRSLPRTESFDLAREHTRQSTMHLSDVQSMDAISQYSPEQVNEQELEYPAPVDEPQNHDGWVFTAMESDTSAENGEQQFSADMKAAGEVVVPYSEAVAGSALARRKQRWVLVVFMILLAGLLIAQTAEKGMLDRFIRSVSVSVNRSEGIPPGYPAMPPEKGSTSYDVNKSVSRTHSPHSRSSVSRRNKSIQRDAIVE